MFAWWKKGKRNRCPGYTTASRLMNTKPLCLSHLEIDRWKLLWYIYFPLAWIFILYFNHPHSHNFLMVHLTLRAEPPNLLSDAKWSSERMNSSAAERVHGQSLSFIQWRIHGPGPPIIFRPNRDPKDRKIFFSRPAPPSPLSKGLDDLNTPPPPPYLKVWIRHCYLPPKLLQYVAYAVTLRSHGRAEAGEHKLEHNLFLKVH